MSKSGKELEQQREINRKHAQNSREKRKRKLDELNEKVKTLEEVNNTLEEVNNTLEEENHKLKLFKKFVEDNLSNELSLLNELDNLDLPDLD